MMETAIKEKESPQLFIEFLGSLIAGFAIWGIASSLGYKKLSTADLVAPEPFSQVAASMPADEDQFIQAACDYVLNNVQYQGYASNLYFVGDMITCSGCRLPEKTLTLGKGNCVAMSSVLASILRNRIPPERIFMAVGEVRFDGIGGHAWCVVQRKDGRWYLLESTTPQKGWVPLESVVNIYIPYSYFNDQLFYCYSDSLCHVAIKGCNCQEFALSYL